LRNILRSGLVTLFVLAAAACGSNSVSSGSAVVPLAGTTWRLVSIQGRPALPNAFVTAFFDEKGLSGSAGCNRYFGGTTLDRERLRVGVLASTKMYCSDSGVMDQEDSYLLRLNEVSVYRVVGSELQLGPAVGAPTLLFTVQ
jgi:heat shock protein HslJ